MPLLAQALLIAALAALPFRGRWKLLALLPAILSLAPLGEGVSLAMMLRGLWGDFSVTSLQLLVLCLAGRPPQALGWRGPALIAASAALFYPLALGLGDFDPYRLGYTAWPLLAVFGAFALAAWWRGQPIWLWLLTIDILAWAAGLLESPNLWDTLLDPLLAAAMLILALRNGWRTYKTRS
ncbi:hypothetical protein [Denitratisoma oestradiolicum]|uniref:Uncharacterized protein n=1 Tax=Denitratisoma oestradiolicum TaxID=311182 RepID=A0A6S6XWD1_9PROT|nr:hypothetical protein [Denitratisoma oestradiolicum]TWO82281.1 hypothetical protein CBW56_02230 [Denitratisoma oestradiolicum]CAB1369234.1 conserved membrane protein of unknown function [Denitratisoma oestradiolicum]